MGSRCTDWSLEDVNRSALNATVPLVGTGGVPGLVGLAVGRAPAVPAGRRWYRPDLPLPELVGLTGEPAGGAVGAGDETWQDTGQKPCMQRSERTAA